MNDRVFGSSIAFAVPARNEAVVKILMNDVVAGIIQLERPHAFTVEERGRIPRSRKVHRQIKALIGNRAAETEHDLRSAGITDRHLVVGIDHSVFVDILILHITDRIRAKLLLGRTVNLLLALEQAQGHVTKRLSYTGSPGILVRPKRLCRVIFNDLVAGKGNVPPQRKIESIAGRMRHLDHAVEALVLDNSEVGPRRIAPGGHP